VKSAPYQMTAPVSSTWAAAPLYIAAVPEPSTFALAGLGAGSVKLIVTRGPGPRSYRPPAEPSVTRIVVSSAPKPRNDPEDGIVVRLCETTLGLNPRLAGLKHLNRLEQVLACAEWDDPAIAEGLMSAVRSRVQLKPATRVDTWMLL